MYKIIITILVLSIFSNCKEADNNKAINPSSSAQEEIKESSKTDTLIDSSRIILGGKYALMTKKTLGKKLMGQIMKNGTAEALKFCSTYAIPIIDSISLANNIKISRVTDKPRNQDNQASNIELTYIEKYKNLLAGDSKLHPMTTKNESKETFYYPITTNPMCIQCHGTEANIPIDVQSQIAKFYPKDKAKGYGASQIRGMWKVEMGKK